MSKYLSIPTDTDGWNEAMYERKCTCGHELYKHAFTMGKYDANSVELLTSQCTICEYDTENKKFLCEGYSEH